MGEDSILAGDLQSEAKKLIDSVRKASADNSSRSIEKVSQDLVSAVQLKDGIEKAYNDRKLATSPMLNLEERVCLGIYTGDTIAESGGLGIRINTFIHNICSTCLGHMMSAKLDEIVPLDIIARELQSMLCAEVKRFSKGKKKKDYISVFTLFDVNGSGTVDADEFKKMLVKLHVVDGLPEDAFPKLLELFDRSKKGHIVLEDLVAFCSNDAIGGIDDYKVSEKSDDVEDDYGITKNPPPATIPRNADADWFLWFLWKEAFKQDKSDPEGVITELEAACTDNEIISPQIS